MARSLNQCNFIGNLGRDVELRYLPSGQAVASFSIAVSDDYKDKDGNKVEQTEWVRISAFGKLGEICGQYLQKGSKIFVSGRMKTRKWQAQDGTDRYSTEIVASEMQMLDSRTELAGGTGEPRSSASGDGGHRASAPPQTPDFDDDIPF